MDRWIQICTHFRQDYRSGFSLLPLKSQLCWVQGNLGAMGKLITTRSTGRGEYIYSWICETRTTYRAQLVGGWFSRYPQNTPELQPLFLEQDGWTGETNINLLPKPHNKIPTLKRSRCWTLATPRRAPGASRASRAWATRTRCSCAWRGGAMNSTIALAKESGEELMWPGLGQGQAMECWWLKQSYDIQTGKILEFSWTICGFATENMIFGLVWDWGISPRWGKGLQSIGIRVPNF